MRFAFFMIRPILSAMMNNQRDITRILWDENTALIRAGISAPQLCSRANVNINTVTEKLFRRQSIDTERSSITRAKNKST